MFLCLLIAFVFDRLPLEVHKRRVLKIDNNGQVLAIFDEPFTLKEHHVIFVLLVTADILQKPGFALEGLKRQVAQETAIVL